MTGRGPAEGGRLAQNRDRREDKAVSGTTSGNPATAQPTTSTGVKTPNEPQERRGASSTSACAVPPPAVKVRSSHLRWSLAVAGGTVFSYPLAWLLSYAASLPFFIGLFFFVLFGLVIGAVTYRIAVPGRPYGRWPLVIGTTIIVATVWSISMIMESRDFPYDMAKLAAFKTRDIGDRTVEEFRAEVSTDVRRFLRERYPPGGTIGYVRWVLTNGRLAQGELESVKRTLRLRRQTKVWWAIRVVLSIALLGFGIGSQTLGLSAAVEPAGYHPQAQREQVT